MSYLCSANNKEKQQTNIINIKHRNIMKTRISHTWAYQVICKRNEERFGTPICAYMSKEEAQERADRANANRSTFDKFYFVSALILHN